MSILSDFKDSLIFEIQKEFWNERGKGARYRLTMVGAAFMEKLLKNPADIDEIVALYKKRGLLLGGGNYGGRFRGQDESEGLRVQKSARRLHG